MKARMLTAVFVSLLSTLIILGFMIKPTQNGAGFQPTSTFTEPPWPWLTLTSTPTSDYWATPRTPYPSDTPRNVYPPPGNDAPGCDPSETPKPTKTHRPTYTATQTQTPSPTCPVCPTAIHTPTQPPPPKLINLYIPIALMRPCDPSWNCEGKK